MNIPARYATGYLGDIGVPPSPCPDGLQRLVRGLPRRPLVHVRRPPQRPPDRPGRHGPRPRRRRRRPDHLVRDDHRSSRSRSGPTRSTAPELSPPAGLPSSPRPTGGMPEAGRTAHCCCCALLLMETGAGAPLVGVGTPGQPSGATHDRPCGRWVELGESSMSTGPAESPLVPLHRGPDRPARP